MSENALPEPDDVTKAPGAVDGDDGDDGGCDDGYRDGDRDGDREGVADGRAESAVGCLLAVAGVAVAGIYALPRAEFSIEGVSRGTPGTGASSSSTYR